MAFVSMILVFIFIIAAILGLIGIVGLILLVVGLVRTKSRKNVGKKSPVVMTIVGAVLLAIPVGVVGILMLTGTAASIKKQIQRRGYTDFTDKWKNEWVTDSSAEREALEWLLEEADNGDKEQLKTMFTDNIRSDPKLDEQLDEFLEHYPKGLSKVEHDRLMGSSGSTSGVEHFSGSVDIEMDGKFYTVRISACYQNDDDPAEVGVTHIAVNDTAGEAAYVALIQNDASYEEKYIEAAVGTLDESSARRIHGYSYEFKDNGRISRDEAVAWLEHERSVSSFIKRFGEPNVELKYSNSTGTDYYWELEPVDGEPRYLHIDAVYDEIIIDLCYICGPENDYSEWFGDDGRIKDKDEE